MARKRELKNKIRSVKNTKKITRTMERISTAKARVCQKRIEAAKPYGAKIAELLRDLKGAGSGAAGDFPLLRVPECTRREALFVVTANRGLCGGYNTNVLRLTERRLERLRADGVEVEVHMIGKKGIARFRYLRRDLAAKHSHFDDKPSFAQAEAVFEPMLARYAGGEVDAVTVVYSHYESASRQFPLELPILPIPKKPDETNGGAPGEFIFEPDPRSLLEALLPLSLKTQFFQTLVEAATCEQIARRVAMKNATDNAEEMLRIYTQLYNRTRQYGITQEILEVIGGAASVS